MAFQMLLCFQKEVNQTVPPDCSSKKNATLFKLCLVDLDDVIFDNYMTLYGQIYMICEFFNGTRPAISTDILLKV